MSSGDPANMTDRVSVPAPEEPPAGEQPGSAAGGAEGTAVATTDPRTAEDVTARLRDWAAAWSEGRNEDYLSFYSPQFTSHDGMSRAEWEVNRAEQLSTARYVRVAITALDVETVTPDRVRTSFFQTYRSEQFEATVRKQLELVLEESSWLIVAERDIG